MTREAVESRLQPKVAGGRETYAALRAAAIAARGLGPEGERFPHGALIYRWKQEVRVFELRGHKELVDTVLVDTFAWLEPGIVPERLKLVALKARLVHRRHLENAVPYGFRYSASSFHENGGLRLGDGEVGLTCATIIAAVFESEGLRLLDPSQWPPPDEVDKATRRKFLERLKTTDREHAISLRRDLSAPRISPEEVVTAGAIHPKLGTFESLQDGAFVVRQRIGT